MSLRKYKNFIDGRFIANSSGTTFDVSNPATAQVIYQVEIADDKIKQNAINSAKEGFLIWSNMTAIARTRILLKAVALLRERNEQLAQIEVYDTGKPWQEASTVDVNSGADCIEYFAGLAASSTGEQQQIGDDFYYTRQEPLGICAGIGAWNYPLQIACWKAAPALASGNVMIFKPSEQTPLGALKLAEILSEAGLPNGVFNVVLGDQQIGTWLTSHPDIAKVSFTGSVATGKKVMENAASGIKKLTMELGGKSPLIIFDDADLDNAVSGAMLANFYTQGEICTNGTRVYVQQGIYPAFIKQLLKRTENNVICGDPMHPDTNFGALISKDHQQKVLDYIKQGLAEGATLLTGGQTLQPDNAPNGYFVAPTIFTDCHDQMRICREEIFGPIMSVLTFDHEDEVIQRANDSEMGLAAGVFSQNIQRAHRVTHQLQAGICWINSYGNSPVEMPVGGYKLSGIGRENGQETLKSYTQTKSIYVGLQPLLSPF